MIIRPFDPAALAQQPFMAFSAGPTGFSLHGPFLRPTRFFLKLAAMNAVILNRTGSV